MSSIGNPKLAHLAQPSTFRVCENNRDKAARYINLAQSHTPKCILSRNAHEERNHNVCVIKKHCGLGCASVRAVQNPLTSIGSTRTPQKTPGVQGVRVSRRWYK
jgi:hypothetical protein